MARNATARAGQLPGTDAPEDETATRTTQIQIAGKSFTVPMPFTEGHVLSAGEASQLNQVFHENIRNNKAKAIKVGGKPDEEFQREIDEYAANYKFGVRTGGGGRTTDPVMKMARTLARAAIEKAMKAKGKKLTEYTAAEWTKKVQDLVDTRPTYMEQARQALAADGAEEEIEV